MASLAEYIVKSNPHEELIKILDEINNENVILRLEKAKFDALKEDVKKVLKFEWPKADKDFGVKAVLDLEKHLST